MRSHDTDLQGALRVLARHNIRLPGGCSPCTLMASPTPLLFAGDWWDVGGCPRCLVGAITRSHPTWRPRVEPLTPLWLPTTYQATCHRWIPEGATWRAGCDPRLPLDLNPPSDPIPDGNPWQVQITTPPYRGGVEYQPIWLLRYQVNPERYRDYRGSMRHYDRCTKCGKSGRTSRFFDSRLHEELVIESRRCIERFEHGSLEHLTGLVPK